MYDSYFFRWPQIYFILALLKEAGWTVDDAGVLRNAAGDAFDMEILLRQGANEPQQIVDIYVEALKRLGINPSVEVIDKAQYTERTKAYDFDMTWYTRGMSLSPGNEQMLYWGPDGVTEPGTGNWMGMNEPAAVAMIDAMLNAPSGEDMVAAVRALDRILTAGRYVVPVSYTPVSLIAHDKNLHYPDTIPIYGDWIGFQPDVWWYAED